MKKTTRQRWGKRTSAGALCPSSDCLSSSFPWQASGWGRQASTWIADQAAWIGSLFLAALGVWSVITALRDEPADEAFAERIMTWKGLIVLAAGALLIGLAVASWLGWL